MGTNIERVERQAGRFNMWTALGQRSLAAWQAVKPFWRQWAGGAGTVAAAGGSWAMHHMTALPYWVAIPVALGSTVLLLVAALIIFMMRRSPQMLGAVAQSQGGVPPKVGVIPSPAMTDQRDQSSGNTFNVTSKNQTGGQTAGIIHNYGPRTRRMTDVQQNALTDAVRGTPAQTFSVVAHVNNHESLTLAEAICLSLQRGGWNRIEAQLGGDIGVSSPTCVTRSFTELDPGIVFCLEKSLVDEKSQVVDALNLWINNSSGLATEITGGRWIHRGNAAETVRIMVGPARNADTPPPGDTSR